MSAGLVDRFVATVGEALVGAPKPVQLHEPDLTEADAEAVAACVRSGWVSSAGPQIGEFEGALAARAGVPHAVAVASGTAALQLALTVAGVAPGDEVLVPSLTFVATANAVSHCGAVPHFVDCEPETLGLDPDRLRAHLAEIAVVDGARTRNRATGRRIAAVAPVHVFGLPARIEEILDVAGSFGVPLIEDATESLGSSSRGRPCGAFGVAGVLSFNGNKIVTTGGGGAVVSADAAFAARVRHLATTAKLRHAWRFDHDEIAWNYRMPNLNAALGLSQLRRFDALLAAKSVLAARYARVFEGRDFATMLRPRADTTTNHWLSSVALRGGLRGALDDCLTALHAAGYMCRPLWTPMHELPPYRAAPRAPLPVTEDFARRVINLPSTARLGAGGGA